MVSFSATDIQRPLIITFSPWQAEPVSSIVTLATVSLTIIRKTTIFIQDALVINDTIQRLLQRLVDLQDYLGFVEAELEKAKEHNENVPLCIRDALTRCQSILKGVKKTVRTLALQESGTFLKKMRLRIRYENLDKDVSTAIEELAYQKSHIKDCMDALNR